MRLTSVLRWQGRTVVGGGAGLWDVPSHGGWWVQLHDETLTEVLGLGPLPGDPGLLVASAYGVATGRRDAIAAVRWSFHTDSLTPNDRFTNAVAVTDAGWVVATEQGVLTMATGSHRWQLSSLRGTPVRALSRLRGQLWAGCDRTGVWYSDDGHRWQAAGHGLADTAVFALAAAGDRILAATEAGVFAGDGIGRWQAVGPALRVAAIGVAGDCWLAGADPGGLWQTDDAGQSWRQTEGFPERVAAICVPRSTT